MAWFRRLLVLGALFTSLVAPAAEIPPPPRDERYVVDIARLLAPDDLRQLEALQHEALEQLNTPLVVVTIERASDYGLGDVDALAHRWFDAWRIGTLGLRGGANQGMLLLVSRDDRKARIELGADWGHSADARCASIMQGAIVPAFKRGDASAGIVAGVTELVQLARTGPRSHPPGDFIDDTVGPLTAYSALPPKPFLVAMGVGLAFILLGIWWPTYRWRLIATGVAIIAVTALTWMIVIVALALLRQSRRGGAVVSERPSRGTSGGSSGGGGASGSW